MHAPLTQLQTRQGPPVKPAAPDGLLLSREELTELTGTVQAARQRGWLERHGWPYLNPVGRGGYPRVSREVLRQKMSNTKETKTSSRPNFDALDRFKKIQ